MIDNKVIAWMMRGALEVNVLYQYIDPSLFYEAIDEDYKPIVSEIHKYFMRHKTPPSFDILRSLIGYAEDSALALSEARDEECSQSEIGHYIDSLKKRYNAQINNELSEIISSNGEENLQRVNNLIKNSLVKIEKLNKNAIFAEGSFNDSTNERLNKYKYIEENPDQVMGVFSGYRELDEYTWGIKNSEMMVISGASSSGKSLLMMNMGVNAWLGTNDPLNYHDEIKNDGKNVVYVTLEMNKEQLEQRIDACIGKIKHRALMRGLLSLEEKERWRQSLKFQREYDKKFYIIDMPRGAKPMEVEAKYESILGIIKPDLLCIDYLGIMSPNNKPASDWENIGYVSEQLHELCRKANIPLITAAQRKAKNKAIKQKDAQEDLEDLGRSKMIGDNANIVLLIENRQEEYLREDMACSLVKNRDGAKGKLTLLKNFEQSRIENMPENWAADMGDENEV